LLILACALKYTPRLISLINNSVVTWNILTILSSLSNTDNAFKGHVLYVAPVEPKKCMWTKICKVRKLVLTREYLAWISAYLSAP